MRFALTFFGQWWPNGPASNFYSVAGKQEFNGRARFRLTYIVYLIRYVRSEDHMILIRDDLSVAALIKSLTGSLHDLRVRFGEVTLSLRFWNGGFRINAVVAVCRLCLGDMPGCILAGLLRQGCMSHTVLLQAKTRRCNKYKAAESPPFTDKTAAVPKRDFNTVQITARGPSHPRHPVENNPGDRHRPIHEATVATITSDDFLVQLAIQHSVMPDLLIDDPVYKFQVNSDSQTGPWGSTDLALQLSMSVIRMAA